jgi:hypothetical protein
MTTLRLHRRNRNTQPSFDHLDMRIAPTSVGAAAALAAEIKVEGRHVNRWEANLATAAVGSHKQQVLLNRIARTEQRIGAQDVRLARIEAGAQARAASPSYRLQGHPYNPNPPGPYNSPDSVTPSYRLQGYPYNPNPPGPYNSPDSVTAQAATTNPQPSTTSITTPVAAAITTSPPTSIASPGGPTGTGTSSGSTSSPLPPNASQVLDVIYNAYIQNPSDFPADIPATNGANTVVVQGTNVGIQVHDDNPGDFNTLVSALQAAGMQITSSSATYGTVVGMLPVAQLPTVAALSDAPSIAALYTVSAK